MDITAEGRIRLSDGNEIPRIGFGVFQMDPDTCERSLGEALSAGYRLVDTANAYMNERAVGRAIGKILVIATGRGTMPQDMSTKLLDSPLQIGSVTLRNRFVMAPMDTGFETNPDGSWSERGMDYCVGGAPVPNEVASADGLAGVHCLSFLPIRSPGYS